MVITRMALVLLPNDPMAAIKGGLPLPASPERRPAGEPCVGLAGALSSVLRIA
jgi:hypothetical protein